MPREILTEENPEGVEDRVRDCAFHTALRESNNVQNLDEQDVEIFDHADTLDTELLGADHSATLREQEISSISIEVPTFKNIAKEPPNLKEASRALAKANLIETMKAEAERLSHLDPKITLPCLHTAEQHLAALRLDRKKFQYDA